MEKVLFTWGYQSRTVQHLEKICEANGVKWIVDVRKRPKSAQPGWSLDELKDFWDKTSVRYRHHGGLGNYGKELPWRRGPAPVLENSLSVVRSMLLLGPVLLLCRETNPFECHRREVAEDIAKEGGIEIRHLGDTSSFSNNKKQKQPMQQLDLFGK